MSQFIRLSDYVIFSGYVLEEECLEPIPHVNIYVLQTRRGTITNSRGYFILKATTNDTIVFSSIAHKNQYIPLSDTLTDRSSELIVLMKPKFYELMSVDIIQMQRYKQLKYEVKNMELYDDEYVFAHDNFPKRPRDLDYHSRAGLSDFGFAFSPITAIYDAFSKEGRERRKLMELLERDKIQAQIESKISIEEISRLTNLNEHQARDFLEWCAFPPEFILNISDYELIIIILNRYRQYRALHNTDK